MTTNKIFELASELKALKENKQDLEFEVKKLNVDIEKVETELINFMAIEELNSFKREGVTFSLVVQEYPAAVLEKKAELYDALKENGFEHLFTVNAQTLSATVKELKSNNDDVLPVWLNGYIKIAEKANIRIKK